MTSRVLVLLALFSCGPRDPEEPAWPTQPEKRIVLGSTTSMSADWAQTCSKTKWSWEYGDYKDDIGSLEHRKVSYACNEQTFELAVKCNIKCELVASPDDGTFHGSASVDVRALELGVMTVDLDLTNTKTAKHRYRRAMVEVALPDTFTLQCFTPAKRWGPCREGISAEQPQLRVFVMSGGAIARSSLLRVNGQPAPKGTDFTTGVPLTAFVPAVAPGKIDIVVSLGAKQMPFTLDAVSAP
jgi:hypothetical protein